MAKKNGIIKKRSSQARPQRKKLDSPTGQGQLIIEIIQNHGRAEEVAKKSGISLAVVSFWRTMGYIPLSRVGEIARALKEDVYAFNYEGVAHLMGKAPKWEEVVKNAGLTKERIKLVLSKPPPPSLKEII